MAVTVGFATGADAGYVIGPMGGGAQSVTAGHRATEYYLSPAEKGGEPPGIWIGEGLADLGVHDGDLITSEDHELFDAIYGDFRDPATGEHLGTRPREVQPKAMDREVQDIYQLKLQAEPGATAERRAQLLTEARAEAPKTVVRYYDTTLSPDKTITLAHASALAAAKEARAEGDIKAAELWESRAAGIWEEIISATRVYIEHQQQEAGYVRTGHHGQRVGDVEAGRFERAKDMPVSIFPQHTSRNGDPQLHVHILWLNRVQTESDGKWRAVDSRGLVKNKQDGAVKAAFALESALERRYGFSWAYREESKGRILKGFPVKVIELFSSRRTEIKAEVAKLVEAYRQARGGQEPSQRVLASMHQHVTLATRDAKGDAKLDMDAKLREWTEAARKAELGTLRDLARDIWETMGGRRADAACDAGPDGPVRDGPARPWWPGSRRSSPSDPYGADRSWSGRSLSTCLTTLWLLAQRTRYGSSTTWPTGRCAARPARRSGGSTLPSTRAFPARCAAQTARASTPRTAPRGSPPRASCRWSSGSSAARRSAPARTSSPRLLRGCSAQTAQSWRRNCATRRPRRIRTRAR